MSLSTCVNIYRQKVPGQSIRWAGF